MARNEIKVEHANEYIYTEYSSGDSNKIQSKQYQEENNNNIDELSKDLSEMGCVVDVVKKPPNICLETCVYEESSSDKDSCNERLQSHIENSDSQETAHDNETFNNDDNTYSDEFDEDSEIEDTNVQNKTALCSSTSGLKIDKSLLKISKSCSNACSSKPSALSGRIGQDFSSISVPQSKRKNMSFTNYRLREIERHNHILLNKILGARSTKKTSIPPEQPQRRPVPAAAVHRKLQQKKIDHDNMILLKKIQRAKSSSCSIRR